MPFIDAMIRCDRRCEQEVQGKLEGRVVLEGRSTALHPLNLTLQAEGAHPRWDAYLKSVYGGVAYPFDLRTLSWLYWTAPLDSPIRVTRAEEVSMKEMVLKALSARV